MNRILGFIIFFLVFVGVYFGMNYYVFHRIFGLFNLHRGIGFMILVSISTISYPLASVIGRNFYNIFTRSLNAIAGTYLGLLFILLSALLLVELFRFIPGADLQTIRFIAMGFAVLLTAYGVINGFSLVTKEIDLPSDRIDGEVSFVQLSDIHIGSVRNSKYLSQVVDKTNGLNPDFVVITGDLVDGSAKLHHGMFKSLNDLKMPAYFIVGNHETYEGIHNVIDVLNETKVRVLRDELAIEKGVQIVGVDYSEKSNYLEKALDNIKLDSSMPSVLLYHTPKDAETASKKGFDLMLSGHTHNGQIIPFNYLVRLQFKHIKGLYEIGSMKLYVNPGTGMWGPPMRIGSKNEITVFNLKKKN